MRCLAALFSLAVLARPAAARPSEEALGHYRRAVVLMQQGDRRAAIAEFEEAFMWSSDPIMLYNIATQYKELAAAAAPDAPHEDLKRAIDYYRRYLAAVPRDKGRAKILAWIASVQANMPPQPVVSRAATTTPPTGSASPTAATPPPPTTRPKEDAPLPVNKKAATPPSTRSTSPVVAQPIPAPSTPPKKTPPPPREVRGVREVLDAEELPDAPVVQRIEAPPPVFVRAETPQPLPDESDSRRKRRVLEATLGTGIGLGLGGIAAGAAMLYWDGRGTCTPVPPVTQCPEIYETSSAGIALVASGGAIALGTAAALLYVELRARRAQQPVAIAPWAGANTLGVSALGAF